MRVLDLFSGIGGFSLGLERAGMETVAFCEQDKFCQKILKKHWPEVPIYDDVRTIRNKFTGAADLICGGFPCQPFSVAGKQKGAADDRHLWPEMFACIKHYRPAWVIGENVAGFINMALDDVLSDLENEGYECRAFVLPACATGAPHRRDRVWIVGHADRHSESSRPTCAWDGVVADTTGIKNRGRGRTRIQQNIDAGIITNTNHFRCEGCISKALQGFATRARQFERSHKKWRDGWPVSTPRVCGVVDGIPNRTHRLRALGNAVVPQIPEILGAAILEASPEAWRRV